MLKLAHGMTPRPTQNPGAALPAGPLALTGIEWLPFVVLGTVLLVAGMRSFVASLRSDRIEVASKETAPSWC